VVQKWCEGTGHARNTSLGFRRGGALLAVIAFLVIGLPVLIRLAGSEFHGFPANAANWESGFRGDRDVGHELVSRRELQIAHKGPTPTALWHWVNGAKVVQKWCAERLAEQNCRA
jgi:hypothetical protein